METDIEAVDPNRTTYQYTYNCPTKRILQAGKQTHVLGILYLQCANASNFIWNPHACQVAFIINTPPNTMASLTDLQEFFKEG